MQCTIEQDARSSCHCCRVQVAGCLVLAPAGASLTQLSQAQHAARLHTADAWIQPGYVFTVIASHKSPSIRSARSEHPQQAYIMHLAKCEDCVDRAAHASERLPCRCATCTAAHAGWACLAKAKLAKMHLTNLGFPLKVQ